MDAINVHKFIVQIWPLNGGEYILPSLASLLPFVNLLFLTFSYQTSYPTSPEHQQRSDSHGRLGSTAYIPVSSWRNNIFVQVKYTELYFSAST